MEDIQPNIDSDAAIAAAVAANESDTNMADVMGMSLPAVGRAPSNLALCLPTAGPTHDTITARPTTETAVGAAVPSLIINGTLAIKKNRTDRRKDWDEEMKSNTDCVLRPDGKSLLCLICVGKGKNKGEVRSRHVYAPGAFKDHCKTKKHCDALAHIKAEKKKKHLKYKQQKPMVSFFKVVKKKKKVPKAAKEKDGAVMADVVAAVITTPVAITGGVGTVDLTNVTTEDDVGVVDLTSAESLAVE